MIVDLQRFIAVERPLWTELESMLGRLESDPGLRLPLDRVQYFHELYERAAADLAKLATFAAEPETHRYLESLVVRAYGEIHETRESRRRIFPLKWFFQTLPQTFRRNVRAFQFAVAITLAGVAFGALATWVDPASRHVTMPFGHDMMTPSQRVRDEENRGGDRLEGRKSEFSARLMTHNIRVSITTLALGMSWGLGTIVLVFYNGIALGAIAVDYIGDGQIRFLLGWLMPHGVIEIPAILVAGQAGFVLASALIGWGNPVPMTARLRRATPDVVTLAFGMAILLVWAGFVEAFLSQYHEPLVPYSAKIAFGAVEALILGFYLARSGDMRTNALFVETPEGIVFSQTLAGPAARCAAWFIDVLCIAAIGTGAASALSGLQVISPSIGTAVLTLVGFAITIGYGIVMEWAWRGQTIGKRLLRLRVVDADGLRLQFDQVVTRNLLRFVDFLPGCYLVGGMSCWLNAKLQRLGDIAANTVVVRIPVLAQPDLDQLLAGKFNSLRSHPHLAARLRQQASPAEATAALQALLRRDEFEPRARVELFEYLAGYFRAKVMFPPEASDGVPDEQYIRNVVDVLYRSRPEPPPRAARAGSGTS